MEADHHDHHQCHIGDGGDVGDGAVPLFPPPRNDAADPVSLVEKAIARLADDVGAIFEPAVVTALTALRAEDLVAYQRLRQRAKQANPACSVTELDRATRGTPVASADERSTLDDLVALARAQCHLYHDADRQAVAVIRLPDRREGLHPTTVNELLRLKLLSPTVVKGLLAGKQPRTPSLIWLKNHEVPASWDDQAALFGRMDR